jgi:hypothetical protein
MGFSLLTAFLFEYWALNFGVFLLCEGDRLTLRQELSKILEWVIKDGG